MKIAYLDCQSGIAGDMLLGALIDAGLSASWLKNEIAKLPVSNYTIDVRKVDRNGIAATQVDVVTEDEHQHRNLNDIKNLIDTSRLSSASKSKSIEIFTALAQEEAAIHGKKINQIHFHEVGAIDSIVDIVGTVIGFEELGIQAIVASKIPVGTGFVECAHGTIPVPVPATLALLRGIPVYARDINTEITTPTAAAFLKCCVKDFGLMPSIEIRTIGYGAGSKILDTPNVLRMVIGEAEFTAVS